MDIAAVEPHTRRPRFRRASAPPAFRLTDDDVEIVRQIGRHRFLRSTHIAELVGRSLDRTNDRLLRLFHAGYIDRPRAQLDYYPSSGSAPMLYAIADRGARLLLERKGAAFANPECSRKNREAGRPFIEHQIEIVDFQVALQRAVRDRPDLELLPAEDLIANFPEPPTDPRHPFALHARVLHHGTAHDIGAVPDLVFGLRLSNNARRNFVVEIDRGTMPITRSDFDQTSFEKKMRGYLAAYSAKQHRRLFGWKNFRVLTVTTDAARMQSMIDAARGIYIPKSCTPLFLFSIFRDFRCTDPLTHEWRDGNNRATRLI